MKNTLNLSDSLKNRLEAIKNESKAARLLLLLNERGTSMSLPVNFIHLRKSGFISFMPFNRRQEINEAGKKGNILGIKESRKKIKKGLEELNNREWISKSEFETINSIIE